MKKILFFCLIATGVLTADNNIYFTSYPTLSPDGKFIVFSFDGDLWSVPSDGGSASRLTAMQGEEEFPRISPDGKWIAFTGSQDGNPNVYIMPVDGGNIKQLTYHDGNDMVSSWSWDSEYIYFTSNRYNRMNTYMVSIKGGTPAKLFDNYFSWPHDLIVNPVTGDYIFTESWESSIFANRKRYKGAFNPDIKSYNPVTKEFKKLTTYIGKDFWPTVDKSGNVFFVSDEANNEYNLYMLKNGKKEQLTSFTSSIKRPQVSANGEYVVFEKDYQIFLYNTAAQKSKKVNILLALNNTLSLEQSFNVKGKITTFDISPDQKKIAFVSRGELFVSDIEGKFVKQLNTLPEGRIKEIYWIDSLNLVFNQTVNGWLNWFTIKVDGKGSELQLTSDQRNNRALSLNSNRLKGIYLSGRDQLRIIDFKNKKSETIVKDEFWALENSSPYFSPDDKYILYTAYRNFEQDIFIYNIDSKRSVNITNTGVSEADPYWSPDGKYIYFETNRYKPAYPYGFQDAHIYRIALENFDGEFKSDRFDNLFSKKNKTDSVKLITKINFNDLKDRWQQITSSKGNQLNPYIIQKKDETLVLYTSNQDGNDYFLWETTLKPFEKPETKKIEGAKTSSLQISKGTSKYYVLAGGYINELDLVKNKTKKIDINFNFNRNLTDEFNEMFYETWANLDENYYDENFHGVNWEKIKNSYAAFLPYLNSRSNLRTLLNDMLGELNSSHQGFRSIGSEEKTFYSTKSAATGIIFENNNPYKVKYIVKNSPLDKAGKNISAGDVLAAVNGTHVNKNMNREYYFINPKLEGEMTLTLQRGDKAFDVKVHPEDSRAFNSQLYNEWIGNNSKYVDKKGNKKIAYVYMKNMGSGSLDKFIVDMTTEAYKRDGLILDLRYNTGGNVHDAVLQFLSQRPYLKWKYRNGQFTIQPNFAPSAKPIVLLINFQTLSDAEMTAAGFKALKLGKIIGTESYRWIIFTSGKTLVDGSFYRLPSWGCYTLDGKDIELNGVKPDIYVETNFKDRIDGKDPQLNKAIEVIKEELK